ncbi:MAG: prenyltransferase/squalene oxidase repeat-containing protein [Planctomycetota bacterium]|jgi:hypothetical protein
MTAPTTTRVTLLGLALLASATWAGDAPKERKQAIGRAFAYLDANLFQLPDAKGTPRKPWTVAIAGLDHLMRYPAGASRAKRAPYGRITGYLADYVDAVEKRLQDPAALPPRHGLASSRFMVQYTWPLSAAGLYFAEIERRGLSRAQARRSMRKIVTILGDAQQANGGWGHGRINVANKAGDPFPNMAGGYPDTLVSSSNCVAICLGILDTFEGLGTDDAVTRARAYYRAAQLKNGSFPYDPSQRSSGAAKSSAGRTAGSLYAWHCLGMPRDRDFRRSVEYLERNLEWIKEGHGSPCMNMMHGALACHMLGKEMWERFEKLYFPMILGKQTEDGGLPCICERTAFGVTCDSRQRLGGGVFARAQEVYNTSLHLFVLLLERDNLKILRQRPPGATITEGGRQR